MLNQFIFLVENVSAAFTLWLGIFIITRDLPWRRVSPFRWQRPTLLIGIATILLAIYLMGEAMTTIAPTPQDFIRWEKFTWWTAPFAILLFFWSVLLLVDQQRRFLNSSLWKLVLFPALSLFALLLTIWIETGLLMQNEAIRPEKGAFEAFFIPVRLPYFYLYNLFVATLLLISVTFMLQRTWRARRDSQREYQKFKWLGYGSIGLVTGAITAAVVYPLSSGLVPKQLGDTILTLGAAAVSFGVARYNALAHEQIIEQDFWHSLLSVTQTALFYLLAFHGLFWVFGYPAPPLVTLLLMVLAIVTQTPLGWNDTLADRMLLPRWVIGYRERLVLLRHTLLTTENPQKTLAQAEATFTQVLQAVRQEEIETLIQAEIDQLFAYNGRLFDEQIMAQSHLQRLTSVQQAVQAYAKMHAMKPDAVSTEQRATVLRTWLLELIKAGLASAQAAEQIEYLILFKKYGEQLSRTEVENYLYQTQQIVLAGGAYSRKLINARKRLALAVRDAELAVRQVEHQT